MYNEAVLFERWLPNNLYEPYGDGMKVVGKSHTPTIIV